MQEPIISPWLIYLINATFVIKMIIMFAGVALAGAAFWFYVQQDLVSCGDKEKEQSYRRKKIASTVASVIFLALAFLIPSKETCYQMLVAHYVTYENVEIVGSQAKELVDYVLDHVNEIANGG